MPTLHLNNSDSRSKGMHRLHLRVHEDLIVLIFLPLFFCLPASVWQEAGGRKRAAERLQSEESKPSLQITASSLKPCHALGSHSRT